MEFTPPDVERKRRTIRFGAVALAVAVVIVGGYFLFFSGDSTPAPVSLPPSFSGYARLHDASTRQAESEIRTGLSDFVHGAHQDAVDAAGVGVYARRPPAIARVVVLAFPTEAVHVSGAPYEVTDEMFGYLLPVNREYPVGAHGGSVRCGPIRLHGVRLVACAWSDAATTGLVYASSSATKPAGLASSVNALRAEIR